MTPEEELARYKRNFADQWARLEKIPAFKKALDEMDLVTLGEIANREVYGDFSSQTTARALREYL